MRVRTRLGQAALDDLARRDARDRVQREHARAVEGHRPADDPGGLAREVAHAAAAVREAHQVVPDALG
jgi:hypothetical protein